MEDLYQEKQFKCVNDRINDMILYSNGKQVEENFFYIKKDHN